MTWSLAFVWTVALEQPFYLLALGRRSQRWWEGSAFCLAANALTHPLIWAWAISAPRSARQESVAELLVVLVEGALLAVLLRRRGEAYHIARGFGFALAANAFSWLAGGALLERLLSGVPGL